MPPRKETGKEDVGGQARNWIKYSGMAFQMIGVMLLFVFAGIYGDDYFGTGPILTIVLALAGVGAGLYVALRDFL